MHTSRRLNSESTFIDKNYHFLSNFYNKKKIFKPYLYFRKTHMIFKKNQPLNFSYFLYRCNENYNGFVAFFLFLQKFDMKKLTIFLFLGFSILAFSQEKEILKVLHTQQSAWNKGNLEEFMSGYWKNDALLFVGSSGPTYGWQKTLDNYKKTYPNKEKMGVLEFSDISVKPLGKDYAFVFGKWKLIREKDTPNGVYTLIFQKFKEGWKIISDHSS